MKTPIREKLLRAIQDGSKYWAVFELDTGLRLFTNNHIIVPTTFDAAVSDTCAEIWRGGVITFWTAKEEAGFTDISPGGLLQNENATAFYRRMGDTLVHERYFRLFPSESEWRGLRGSAPARPLRVFLDGQQVGIVRPMAPPTGFKLHPNYDHAEEPVADQIVYQWRIDDPSKDA